MVTFIQLNYHTLSYKHLEENEVEKNSVKGRRGGAFFQLMNMKCLLLLQPNV